MNTIRFGIAGPGNIARRFAQAVKNVPGAEPAAVASRDPARAKAFSAEYGIPHIFESYEAMAESDLVDVVYIATPHSHHAPCAQLFLRSGKHVLCEKPICVNASQARELHALAQEHGVFLMEAMWTRFLPALLEAQDLVRRGEIGQVLGVQADFCYSCEPRFAPRLYLPELAGGALLDVGIYGLHLAAMFLGSEPKAITALAQTREGVDLHTGVLLQYADGALANISSAIHLTKPETAYIYGTRGQITLPHFYGAQELHICNENGERTIQKPWAGNGFEEEIVEVCRCIRAGNIQSDILPPRESITILEQMDRIRAQIGIRYPFE